MPAQPPYVGSTRFYVGRGPDAREVGSTTTGFIPYHFLHQFQSLTDAEFTEEDFRELTASYTRTCQQQGRDATAPTQWVMAYDKGSIYLYFQGVEMAVLRCNHRRWVRGDIASPDGSRDVDEFVPRKAVEFPAPRKDVTSRG